MDIIINMQYYTVLLIYSMLVTLCTLLTYVNKLKLTIKKRG